MFRVRALRQITKFPTRGLISWRFASCRKKNPWHRIKLKYLLFYHVFSSRICWCSWKHNLPSNIGPEDQFSNIIHCVDCRGSCKLYLNSLDSTKAFYSIPPGFFKELTLVVNKLHQFVYYFQSFSNSLNGKQWSFSLEIRKPYASWLEENQANQQTNVLASNWK